MAALLLSSLSICEDGTSTIGEESSSLSVGTTELPPLELEIAAFGSFATLFLEPNVSNSSTTSESSTEPQSWAVLEELRYIIDHLKGGANCCFWGCLFA